MDEPFIFWLKSRLKQALPGVEAQVQMVPPASMQSRFEPIKNPVLSSVLLLLFKKDGVWNTVLIKRPEYNGHHSGQISLPGGKAEQGDADLIATALRETYEEIGVEPTDVEIVGKLSSVQIPVSGFLVEPYIGVVNYTPVFLPDPKEVSKIITTDIWYFVKQDIRDVFTYKRGSFCIDAPYFKLNGEKLWGATAMMFCEFGVLLNEYKNLGALRNDL